MNPTSLDQDDPRLEVVGKLVVWAHDPVAFVRDVFGPGYEAATGKPLVIDRWQRKSLRRLVRHHPHGSCDGSPHRMIAAKACKGVGKTTWEAWICWWRMFFNLGNHRGACVSLTGGNLRSGLWPELALWLGYSPLLTKLFEHKGEVISARGKDRHGNERSKTCWMQLRTFQADASHEKQAETLAGLHASAGTILIDEAGSVPVGVIKAAQAVFNVKGQDWLLAVGGNCTDEDGALHWICTQDADRWFIVTITGDPDDPDHSPRIDIDMVREEIRKKTRNDPMVMINYLAQWPPRSGSKLLSANEVEHAMRRNPQRRLWENQPRVWGLDVAGEGLDPDEAVLSKRQGCVAFQPRTWRNVSTEKIADQVDLEYKNCKREPAKYGKAPKKIFVDRGGVGRGCYERLKTLIGADVVVGVDFGETAVDEEQYYLRRTEMWCKAAIWVREVGALPDVPELRRDLAAPKIGTDSSSTWGTRYSLESKDDMKKRGCPSPDYGDSFGLTFAADVLPDEPEEQLALAAAMRAGAGFDPYKVLGGRT